MNGKNEDVYRISCLCGGAAVLILLFKEWVNKNNNVKAWCVKTILNTLKNPPNTQDLYLYAYSTWWWDSFCAEVLPYLFCEDLNNKEIKEDIIFIITRMPYKAIEIFFNNLTTLFNELANKYRVVVHLLIRMSFIKVRIAQYVNKDETIVNKYTDLYLEERKNFLQNKILPDIPEWGSIMDQYNFLSEIPDSASSSHLFVCSYPEVNLIKNALNSLPKLTDPVSENGT